MAREISLNLPEMLWALSPVRFSIRFQRGRALAAAVQAVARQLVDGRAEDAPRVDAEALVPEIAVLHTDDSVPQRLRELLQRRPDAVVFAGKNSIFRPIAAGRVRCIYDGVFRHLQHIEVGHVGVRAGQAGQIRGKYHGGHARQHHAHAAAARRDIPDAAQNAPCGFAAARFEGRCGRSAAVLPAGAGNGPAFGKLHFHSTAFFPWIVKCSGTPAARGKQLFPV